MAKRLLLPPEVEEYIFQCCREECSTHTVYTPSLYKHRRSEQGRVTKRQEQDVWSGSGSGRGSGNPEIDMRNFIQRRVHFELQGHPVVPVLVRGLKFCSTECARLATDEDNNTKPMMIYPTLVDIQELHQPPTDKPYEALPKEKIPGSKKSVRQPNRSPGHLGVYQCYTCKQVFYLRGYNELHRVNAQANVDNRIRDAYDLARRRKEATGIDLQIVMPERVHTRNVTNQGRQVKGIIFCSEKCLQIDNDADGAANKVRLAHYIETPAPKVVDPNEVNEVNETEEERLQKEETYRKENTQYPKTRGRRKGSTNNA